MWLTTGGFILLLSTCYGQLLTQKDEHNTRQLLHYPSVQSLPLSPQTNLLTSPKGYYQPLEQQVLIYQGGIPGQQPFLLQPGGVPAPPPPGNFLIPQPGFVLRDVPQRPTFYPGAPVQPKPAFTPPINKDAEEIPTNPAHIPPFRSQDIKPEKLETFDEKPEIPQQTEIEIEDISKNGAPSPSFPDLRPGQRFFILNGQPLFANYPIHFINQQQPGRFYYQQPAEFSKVPPQRYNVQDEQVPIIEDFLLRNRITGEISNVKTPTGLSQSNLNQNVIELNRPITTADDKNLLQYTLPLQIAEINKEIRIKSNQNGGKIQKLEPVVVRDDFKTDENLDDFRYESDDDSVIIDAKYDDKENDADVVQVTDKKEPPATAQAQPGAIALAGPGGVASAGPRATALVGDGGLAVSSPKATAVAGPRDEEDDKKNKSKKPK